MITAFSGDNVIYKGIAEDSKPADARNGDRFIEMDTGALLIFDEENTAWRVLVTKTDPTSNLVGFGRVGYMIISE